MVLGAGGDCGSSSSIGSRLVALVLQLVNLCWPDFA